MVNVALEKRTVAQKRRYRENIFPLDRFDIIMQAEMTGIVTANQLVMQEGNWSRVCMY